jgi:hypothetical protein
LLPPPGIERFTVATSSCPAAKLPGGGTGAATTERGSDGTAVAATGAMVLIVRVIMAGFLYVGIGLQSIADSPAMISVSIRRAG